MPPTEPSLLSRFRALAVVAGLTIASLLGACSGGEPTPGESGEGTDVNTDLGDGGDEGDTDSLQTDGQDTDAGDTGTGNPGTDQGPGE